LLAPHHNDSKGRLLDTYDNDRNIVEHREYEFQATSAPVLTAMFTPNTDYKAGQQTIFTNVANCVTITSYSWTLYNYQGQVVASGSNNTFAHTFSAHGLYNLKLVVTSSSYGSDEYASELRVVPADLTPVMRISSGSGNTAFTYLKCNTGDQHKTFSFTGLPSGPGIEVDYDWLITGSGTPVGSSITGTHLYNMAMSDINVSCVLKIKYPPNGSQGFIQTITIDRMVDFVDNSPCY
jgi:hypothetical protein